MKPVMKSILLALGITSLAAISSVAFATPPAPEMDGDLMGQVSLLIAGVYFVAKASSKKK
jgi:hypothetical protein